MKKYLRIKQTPIYYNCEARNMQGEFMFFCHKKRADWYLSKGLAEIIKDDPFIFQLTFEPKGIGCRGDAFYENKLENKCVVCGSNTQLTQHHVVPYSYRKHFPDNIKKHSSHDVLPICDECHIKYEVEADKLRIFLEEKYNVSPVTISPESKKRHTITGVARVLKKHSNHIPEYRINQLKQRIAEYLNKEILEDGDIDRILNYKLTKEKINTTSKQVVKAFDNLQDLIILWRQHFIDVLQPKYMPLHWDVFRVENYA